MNKMQFAQRNMNPKGLICICIYDIKVKEYLSPYERKLSKYRSSNINLLVLKRTSLYIITF